MTRVKNPLEFPNGHPCLTIQEDERIEDEKLSDLIALGMPSEDHVRLTIRGEFFDAIFTDYTLELYGFWPEDLERGRRYQGMFAWPNCTLVRFPSEKSGHVFEAAYCFWLLRVRFQGTTVRELIWHPDIQDYLSALRNVWIVYSEPAKALLSHIQQTETTTQIETQVKASRGRPQRFANTDAFLAALNEAANQLESDGFSLSQPNIAGIMETDQRGIRRWCRDFHVDWEQWKRSREKPDKNRK
ncbi:MAG: hypothetical protein V7641_3632 [Blastocatellia bacterium]